MGMHLSPELERKCLELAIQHPKPTTPPRAPPLLQPHSTAVRLRMPVVVRSEANLGGKLRCKLARKNQIKAGVHDALAQVFVGDAARRQPVTVTLTRLAAKKLDDDNLRRAMKPVRDEVAAWLGMDDADPRITWRYDQRAAWALGIELHVEFRETR